HARSPPASAGDAQLQVAQRSYRLLRADRRRRCNDAPMAPLVLAPLLWAIAFFYVALESDLVRAALVICGLIAAQFFVAVAAFF
ncbi:MAG: hypothetical protein AAFU55_12955, partial [Pseudomonadota bacterium]